MGPGAEISDIYRLRMWHHDRKAQRADSKVAQVVLTDINKRWGDVYGVRDMNLNIADREFLVLLGPSGCGKTTTMRMVAGLDHPSAGEIRIGERVVNTLEPKDRDVAMVFQNYGLYPNMSVFENIRFPLKIRKIPGNEHDTRVRRAADMVELTELLDRKPKELSGGQRQRVALARAIVREPTVFLMDEPLSNLDAKLRVTMRAQLKNLQHQLAVTTLYVTHDQIEAMTLADRIVVMNKGSIMQIGTPEAVYNKPANLFVAGFIGSPAMNLVEGEYTAGVFSADNITLPGLPTTFQEAGPAGSVTLGYRAEDVSLVNTSAEAVISAPVYSMELLGDATMITVRVGGTLVSAKADKSFRAAIGDTVHLNFDAADAHLFDTASGERCGEHSVTSVHT